ncbi:MAG: FAD-dependent oxidoreductase [Gemmataceae bacterium]|nr:FAD-dependent oxidoreductase [Gemmataceae bacterium]
MAKAEPLRVAVLGAGPVGLEAALYARACGLPVAVYERGQVGDHLLRWGHARLFTPFGWNASPLGLRALLRERPARDLPAEADILTGRQFRDAYLVRLAESEALLESMHLGWEVLHVGRPAAAKKADPDDRRPFRLLVRGPNGAERIDQADVVLDCTGTYATPNRLGDGGIPAVGERAARPHLSFGLEDVLGDRKDHYAGRSVVLVGDGYTAGATICALAALAEDHPATWAFWLTRGPRGQPLPRLPNDPLKERDRLAAKANSLATRCDGNLEFHPQTLIDEVVCHGPDKGFRVAGRTNGKPVAWEVERVIGAVGSRPDPSLGLGLRADEPGYFVLGAKAGGPAFLMRDGLDQIRKAFAAILGNPRVDLYANKAA